MATSPFVAPAAADLPIDLLRRLCAAPGIAGREDAVRALLLAELTPLVDEINVDALGNVIGVRYAAPTADGTPPRRVMIAAHMDEIGFIVRHIDAHGFLRLHPVGGFDPNRLPAQRVLVHGHAGGVFPGAISVAGRPIHLLTPAEVQPVTIPDLFVDLGLPPDEVHAQVEVGDMVTLERDLIEIGANVMSHALDDRVGLFILLETLRALDGPQPVEIIAVATVQEEVGTRGAQTAAWALNPDVAIAVDITPAADTPGASGPDIAVYLNRGIALKLMDTGLIADHALNQQLRAIAEARDIPWQWDILGRGGSDAAAMQRTRAGRPATTLSLPVRYAHTVNELASRSDIAAAIALLGHYLSGGDDPTVAT